ncbi:uncharacterized protein LOC106151407 [Lingula anatina]|uniref:Uncharacterized protein LOC106151407 n=1 Tax=Lingula anatina TaxID=7574 RepID=A0A1S3H1V3_LINAN|nr:uncharacterized protein LOC106151407 [Lingula anatina]|eukprot:XP_013380105.1 uncharacterized protein LOC106151407 [Lingula anatina]
MVTTDGSNSLAKYDNSGTGYTVADCQAFCLAENTFHCTATIHYSDYGYGHGYCLHFGFSPYVEPSAISYRRYCTDEALSSCYLEEVGQNLGIYYTVQYSLDNSTCATRCFDRERCIGYNTFTGGHNRCRLFEQRKMSRYGATLSIRLRKCG